MPSSQPLPTILVSAEDASSASAFIADLVDNDVTEEYVHEGEVGGRVWRIVNKYYSADVLLLVQTQVDSPGEHVQAHIICLNQHECSADVAESRRYPGTHGVRLVLAHCQQASDSLLHWATKHWYEVVPMLERADEDDPQDECGAFAELYGAARARAALHAHRWLARRPHETESEVSDDGSESSDGGSRASIGSAASVERAEEFCVALQALGSLPADQRRQHADTLVAAFCRALGHTLDL